MRRRPEGTMPTKKKMIRGQRRSASPSASLQRSKGACFCFQAEDLIEYYECLDTNSDSAPVDVHDYCKWLRALVKCRSTRLNRRLLLYPVSEVSFGQRRESWFITEPVVVQRADNQCKNRDSLPRKAGSLLILLSVLDGLSNFLSWCWILFNILKSFH